MKALTPGPEIELRGIVKRVIATAVVNIVIGEGVLTMKFAIGATVHVIRCKYWNAYLGATYRGTTPAIDARGEALEAVGF